jgi:hypothetical protein
MDIAVSSQVRRSADAVLAVLAAALGARRACPEEHDDPAYPFARACGPRDGPLSTLHGPKPSRSSPLTFFLGGLFYFLIDLFLAL